MIKWFHARQKEEEDSIHVKSLIVAGLEELGGHLQGELQGVGAAKHRREVLELTK